MKTLMISAIALGFMAMPSAAEEVCFTKALNGADIDPPMCRVAESLVQTKEGVCEWVIIPSGGKRCVFDRPEPPRPYPVR
jgi:hypothetical protein